jgi:hypothetical protein
MVCSAYQLFYSWLVVTCVNFILNVFWERCSVPVGCLPHAFLQSKVCRSAVHCLKSQRAALLSQATWQEGAFARTHTSIVAITSPIRFLFLAGGDLCEFHTEQ